ncbi:MAG: carbon monoxide dehydrogenase subunit G [Bryobacteraceae bacterium]|nr:carbon monoxide dehydrogenase subunit G [Bryobacteraceae bacterium]
MKIAGSHTLPFAPERAYNLLQDPQILAACMPGCEQLVKIAEDTYQMKMKMVLAAISGQFDGKVRIADPNPHTSFRLIVEGTGKIGFMKGDGRLTLAPKDTGTEVAYEGDVQVGGTMAAVGQRLIDTTSKMMIKRFFDKLCEKAGSA